MPGRCTVILLSLAPSAALVALLYGICTASHKPKAKETHCPTKLLALSTPSITRWGAEELILNSVAKSALPYLCCKQQKNQQPCIHGGHLTL